MRICGCWDVMETGNRLRRTDRLESAGVGGMGSAWPAARGVSELSSLQLL